MTAQARRSSRLSAPGAASLENAWRTLAIRALQRLVRHDRDPDLCHRGDLRALDRALWRGARSSARPISRPAPNSGSAPTRSAATCFSRLIYGARNTIGIAFATTLLSFVIGGTLGVSTALKRGWLDQGISRIVDAFLAIPVLIFALMLLAVFGKSILNADPDPRPARLHPRLPPGPRHGAERRGDGLCRGGQAARRRHGLDHLQGDPAQHPAADDHRIRPALLLRLPHHLGAVLPWRRHPAAHRRLGLHGGRKQDADHLPGPHFP